MGSLDTKLAKAGKFFAGAAKKVETNPGSGEWEDGRYAIQVTKCNVNESQSSGRLQVSFTLKGLEGEIKGQTIQHHQGIENEQGQEYLFRDFARLGYTQAPENPAELKALCAKIEKKQPKARISVKTKGEYQNVRFLGGLSAEVDESGEEGSEEVSSEEEAESGEAELQEGSKVEVTLSSGKTFNGTVLAILEKEEKVRVEDDETKKTFKVGADQVVLLSGEEVPDEPEAEAEAEAESEEEEAPAPKKGAVAKKTGSLKKK